MRNETIFDHNVTDQEIKELFKGNTDCRTVADYKEFAKDLYSGFAGDFMRFMELCDLFSFRGLKDEAEKYRRKAHDTEYWKLRAKNPRRT